MNCKIGRLPILSFVFVAISISLLIVSCNIIPFHKNASKNDDELINQNEWLAPSCIENPDSYEIAQVIRVVDGDSILVLLDGRRIQVRYIGINAPDYGLGIDAQARAAERANRELVEGKTVKLFRDVSNVDKFNRLLRYVFVNDIFINQYLIQSGFAQPKAYPPDIACQALLSSSR